MNTIRIAADGGTLIKDSLLQKALTSVVDGVDGQGGKGAKGLPELTSREMEILNLVGRRPYKQRDQRCRWRDRGHYEKARPEHYRQAACRRSHPRRHHRCQGWPSQRSPPPRTPTSPPTGATEQAPLAKAPLVWETLRRLLRQRLSVLRCSQLCSAIKRAAR